MSKSEIRIALIKPNSDVVEIHNPPSRVVDNITGLGFNDRTFSLVRGVFQNGNTLLSQRLEDRQIGITLLYPGCSRDQYLNHRNILLELFRENNSSLSAPELYTLVFQYLHNRQIVSRYIDVYLSEGPGMNPPRQGTWDHFSLTDDIVLTAPYPIWYDPTLQSNNTRVFTEQLTLSMTFPFILGSWKSNTLFPTYSGDWEAFPIITIEGPAEYFSIINNVTEARLDYDGVVSAGETLTITLTPTSKTCVNNFGTNLISNLSGDLGTFTIQPVPPTASANTFSMYTENAQSSLTNFTISYYNQYRGI